MVLESLKDAKDNEIVRKIVELDRKYNFTDMILGFLLGFAVTLLIVYLHPEWFDVTVNRGCPHGLENLDNFTKENLENLMGVLSDGRC